MAKKHKTPHARAQIDPPIEPGYRTGAVARMLRMPAATLRIWERRYRITTPPTTPSGHRQYSSADVRRLALVRQLTTLGHPIGALAALDIEQLREVVSTHASALSGTPDRTPRQQARSKVGVGGTVGGADKLRIGTRGTAGSVGKPAKHLPVASSKTPRRRYDDATLADFAGLSSTIACECPRHLAQIVMQLSLFEEYSGQCQRLDAADAALHEYLGRVTGTARSLFESALERVAIHEGLVLP